MLAALLALVIFFGGFALSVKVGAGMAAFVTGAIASCSGFFLSLRFSRKKLRLPKYPWKDEPKIDGKPFFWVILVLLVSIVLLGGYLRSDLLHAPADTARLLAIFDYVLGGAAGISIVILHLALKAKKTDGQLQ